MSETYDLGVPPYDFILVFGFQPSTYNKFKDMVKTEPQLRMLKIGRPGREEIDFLNESGLDTHHVYIINEPTNNDIRNMRKYAREIYE